MWMTIYNAMQAPDTEESARGKPPAHCPHPKDCLRLPLSEPRSFSAQSSTRQLLLNRYRLMMSKQCACNGPCPGGKT